MKTKEHIGLSGTLRITVYDAWGNVRDFQKVDNIITDVGLLEFVNYFVGLSPLRVDVGHPTAMAVGTDNTAPAVSQTALGNEVFRKEITRRITGGIIATIQTLILDTEANGFTLTEAGVFTSTVAGAAVMISRVTFNDIVKTSSIQMTLDWDYSVARSS